MFTLATRTERAACDALYRMPAALAAGIIALGSVVGMLAAAVAIIAAVAALTGKGF